MTATDYERSCVPSVSLDPLSLLDAAASADVIALRTVMSSGADINVWDAAGRTIVCCTIAGDSWENVDVSDAAFKRKERLEILDLLICHPDISLYSLNAPVRGVSPLCLASWLDLPEMVELLLHQSHKMVAVNGMDTYGFTPLMYAARDGSLEVVRILLANGARPDYRDINHRSSIQYALGHAEVLYACECALRLHRLREFTTDNPKHILPPVRDYSERRTSASSDMHDIYDTSRFSSHNLSDYLKPTEVLVEAILTADIPRLQTLLFSLTSTAAETSQSLVNLPDSTGWSPVHHCVSTGQPSVEILDALYLAGADVSLYTTSGHETPLHCLAYNVLPPADATQAASIRSFVTHLVRDLRAPLAARDHNNNTCLHVAAEHGKSIEVLMAFLACDTAGKVRELRNLDGLTALDVVRPELRAAFGVSAEVTRPASVASWRTIRPATSLSSRSTPLAINGTSPSSWKPRNDSPARDTLVAPYDYSALPELILENLRIISPHLSDNDSCDADEYRQLLQETSEMRDLLITHLRTRLGGTAEELDDARRVLRRARKAHREVQQYLDAVVDTLTNDAADGYGDAKRRTADSMDSEATAIIDARHALYKRKCCSMTNLMSSHEPVFVEVGVDVVTAASAAPTLYVGCLPHDSMISFDKTSILDNASQSTSSEAPKYVSRKRSTTFPESRRSMLHPANKVAAVSGTTKFKAWLRKIMKPEAMPKQAAVLSPHSELHDDITATEYTKLSSSDRGQSSGRRSIDKWKRREILDGRKCLQAVQRDLSRIHDCLDEVNRFITDAKQSITKADISIRRAIIVRQEHLDLVHPVQLGSRARSTSVVDRNGQHSTQKTASPSLTPSLTELVCTQRRRAQSANSSAMSYVSRAADGDDDETRVLRRVMTRKIEARLDGADEGLDRAVVWLRIVKEILQTLRTQYGAPLAV